MGSELAQLGSAGTCCSAIAQHMAGSTARRRYAQQLQEMAVARGDERALMTVDELEHVALEVATSTAITALSDMSDLLQQGAPAGRYAPEARRLMALATASAHRMRRLHPEGNAEASYWVARAASAMGQDREAQQALEQGLSCAQAAGSPFWTAKIADTNLRLGHQHCTGTPQAGSTQGLFTRSRLLELACIADDATREAQRQL